MTAFARAVELGYRYLETDVHATADGTLLAFHDPTLNRVTDRRGTIAELPYAEVARARIAGTEPIPLLRDILDAWPQARLNIDVKAPAAIGPLVEILHRAKAWDRVCIASFSSARLAAVRTRARVVAGHEICTALGPRGIAALRARSLARPLTALVRPGGAAACAQVPERLGGAPFVTPALVATAHDLGLAVHVWTVNDAAAMNRLLDLGVDGIMTDDLDTLRDVMRSRDLWPAR
jgi:glycerophosphoryl diester phosphodiesterase